MADKITKKIRVYGIVQGVGFRPTVSRHASACGITGSVCNRGPYVEILARGAEAAVTEFERLLAEEPPRRAAILKIDSRQLSEEEEEAGIFHSFEIVESGKTKGDIFISPDIAICEDCSREMYDPGNPRYLHPFINCTCCGPRLTILDALPYDRERTSMKEFPMCPECEAEYYNPATRRYDAQPVCCNKCGPEVYLLPLKEIEEGSLPMPGESFGNQQLEELGLTKGLAAINTLRKALMEGKIAAVKGIGGFHLCCNARDESAVQLLRSRKNRPVKPLAVMMKNMETVKRECLISPEQEKILTGHQKPILLLEKRQDSSLAASIAPGNPKVGVMLPYAPVQMLLFEQPEDPDTVDMTDCLVMTSGNESGAPICRDDRDAVMELGELCDLILSHNRKIRIRADDTVMDFYRGKPYMIRRSRGYAPLPFMTSLKGEAPVLAIGGELKNTFCIGTHGLFYPSPYVGDLEDIRTMDALLETVERFETLLEVKPKLVVCDLHPRYRSTEAARLQNLPILYVQHHYAHILSCMAENDYLKPVIGVSFDGTGYGTDGSIWGGEILLADLRGFTREDRITPFLQIGGDASSREGWRIALSMIYSLTGSREKTLEIAEKLSLCSPMAANVLMTMADRKMNAVISTSAGRLFDAAAAILGIVKASTFEGEAATSLQFAAEKWEKEHPGYRMPPEEIRQILAAGACPGKAGIAEKQEEEGTEEIPGGCMPTDRLFGNLLIKRLENADPEKLAWNFHECLAEMILESCENVRQKSGLSTVALSGGCFQNLLLLRLVSDRLESDGFEVLRHSLIPPNDGGLAIGQALFGIANQS